MWFPTLREDRYLNIVAAALVLLLLSLGFEILKLPALISPERPPLPQFVGLVALLMLNAIVMWSAARDDFLRLSYGAPKVAATLLFLTLLASLAFFTRGLWDGTYIIDLDRPVDMRRVLTIAIGGQFVIMVFMSAYFLKKTDSADVRKLKRTAAAGRHFLEDWLAGKIPDAARFNERYTRLATDLAAMPETARTAGASLPPPEAEHARALGSFFSALNDYIAARPDAAAMANGKSFAEEREDMVRQIIHRKAFRLFKARMAA